MSYYTPFSTYTDDECIRASYTKDDASALEVELALRLEAAIGDYQGLLESVHQMTSGASIDPAGVIDRLHRMSGPSDTIIPLSQ